MSYWIVASSAADETKDAIFTILKDHVLDKNKLCESIYLLDVPENLKFGTFDSLIKYADDLGKYDTQVEAVLKRIERCLTDMDTQAEFKVLANRSELTVDEYISKFRWDDAKFPRNRNLQDNVTLLMNSTQKLDEEVKSRVQTLTELKQQVSQVQKRDQATLVQRDLIDVLTPELVKPDQFIYTEHLTTQVVLVPRGMEKEWLACYEQLNPFVVPGSSERLPGEDKEGNELWRVVLFKSSVEAFRQAARHARFVTREFVFDPARYAQIMESRTALSVELKKQEQLARKICQAAFSDALVAYLHLKALRVFVEAVLRFGLPPRFAAFVIRPSASKQAKLRAELANNLGKSGFGAQMSHDTQTPDNHNDDELGEYYPYVFFPMSVVGEQTK